MLLCFIPSAESAGDGVNIALGKPVSATGWYAQESSEAHAPYKINDGDVNSAWANGEAKANGLNYCTIDLGSQCLITKIIARTRRDMDQTYNRYGWYIVGSNTGDFTDSVVLGTKASAGEYLEDFELKFSDAVSYRFIRVQSERDIVVSELEVYGSKLDSGSILYNDTDDAKYCNPIRLNNYMKLIEPLSMYEFGVNTLITRGEAAKIIAAAMNAGGEYEYKNAYADVSVDTEYSGYIQCLKDNGIISEAQSFRPSEYITCAEFIKMAEYVLGYGKYMDLMGGFDEGTMTLASEIYLLKDTDLYANSKLTRGEAVIVLYNMMLAFPSKAWQSGAVSKFNRSDKTYLEHKFDLKLIKGIVNANAVTSVNSAEKKAGKSIVEIDGIMYLDKDDMLFDHVGESMYVLAQGDELDIKASWEDVKSNTVYTVAADDIEDSRLDEITADSGGKSKKYRLENSYMVLLNGVAYFDYNADTLKPEDGFLELVDNDNDGKAEVVRIWQPEIYVSKTYSFEESSIYISDVFGNKQQLIDIDTLDIRISGEKSGYEDIKTGSSAVIIKLYRSPDGMYVKTDYGIGSISNGIPKSITGEFVTVDGEEYAFSSYYLNNKSSMDDITVGRSVELAYDEFGKVLAVLTAESSKDGEVLAYIRNVTGDEDNVFFKVFTENASFELLPAAEKVHFDGKNTSRSALAEFAQRNKDYFCGSMAYYRLNDNGEIVLLETEKSSASNRLEPVDGVINENCYRYGTAIYSSSYMVMAFKSMSKSFIVPMVDGQIPTSSAYDRYYQVSTIGDCIPSSIQIKDSDWNLKFYNADDYTIPQFLVMQKNYYNTENTIGIKIGTPVAAAFESPYLVESVKQKMNDDGDICLSIVGYGPYSEGAVELTIAPDIEYMYEKYKIISKKKSWLETQYMDIDFNKISDFSELLNYVALISDIKGGDIIAAKVDGNEAISVERIFSAENSKAEIGLIYSGGSNYNYSYAATRIMKGTYSDNSDGRLVLETGGGRREIIDTVTIKNIIVIDKQGKASKISKSELAGYAARGVEMAAYTKWANVYMLVLYED